MTHHVVIAGGGVGALEGLLALQHLAADRLERRPDAPSTSEASSKLPWSPAHKVAGRHLGRYLDALGAKTTS
jgi:hypothetical protein